MQYAIFSHDDVKDVMGVRHVDIIDPITFL